MNHCQCHRSSCANHFHTKLVTTSPKAKIPNVEHVEFSEEEALAVATKIVRMAVENFRKRQMRLSHDRVQSDRERLLRSFLEVADDIARALVFGGSEPDDTLREGVQLTHRRLTGILDREGVVSVEAIGKPFDPTVHEAVGTVPGELAASPPDTVVEVVREGYMFNGRLLRPARVVVAT